MSLVCSIVGGEMLGVPVSALRSIRLPLSRIFGVGFISLASMMIAVLGCCAGCIGMPVALWLFSVAPAAYVLEGGPLFVHREGERRAGVGDAIASWLEHVFRSLGRSVALVKGWDGLGRWLGYTVVGGIMVAPLSALSSVADDPSVREALQDLFSLDGGAFSVLSTLLNGLFVGAAYAYMAVNMTVFYFDRRVEREALDLELALERLSGPRS